MSDRIVTPEFVRSVMHYDPETGQFTWTKRLSIRVTVGAIVGSLTSDGYRSTRLFGKAYRLHRLAFLYMTGEWPKDTVDHINRIKSDNRWCNLRPATLGENQQNCSIQSNNVSGCTGVFRNAKTNKWLARITINHKTIKLGDFSRKEDATAARKAGEAVFFTHAAV